MTLLVPLGLYPFVFQPLCQICDNDAAVSAPRGLTFEHAGIVTDRDAGPLLAEALMGRTEISIAVHATSASLRQIGPARIFSLSTSPVERNFTLGQERGDLVLRLRTPRTGKNGNRPEVIARDVIRPYQTQFFVAAYDGHSARLFVDGTPVVTMPLEAGGFSNWDPDFPLVFGNERSGNRPWRGTLHDAAVYARALPPEAAASLRAEDLARDEPDRIYHLRSRCPLSENPKVSRVVGACELPQRFIVDDPPKVLHAGRRGLADYLQNAALYLLAGALLVTAVGARRPRWPWLLLAVIHPLLIELMQTAVVSRSSSLHDVASSWIGLTLGALAARLVTSDRSGRSGNGS